MFERSGSRPVCRKLWLYLLVSVLPLLACGEEPGAQADDEPRANGCTSLAQITGPEDFDVETRRDRLLVSSQDRRNPSRMGAIFSVSMKQETRGSTRPLALQGRGECSFHPHGVFLQQARRPARLYVINHHDAADLSADRACFPAAAGGGDKRTSIEVFEVHDLYLDFVERLADPEILKGGNDLAVDPAGRVYVTVPPSTFFQLSREKFLDSQVSQVARYCPPETCTEGRGWSVVAEVGRYVNGIALDIQADGSREMDVHPIVSSSLDGGIYEVFPKAKGREPKWHELRNFGLGHDNLLWLHGSAPGSTDHSNELLVASHSDLRRLIQHGLSSRATSPSVVRRFDPRSDAEPIVLLSDDGSTISGASVAACVHGDLILGQIFGDSVLRCATTECPKDEESGGSEEASR